MTWRERILSQNPIRVAGFLALFFLAGPGTFAGACMLLAHAGVDVPFDLPHPATHAQMQLIGFFLFHIWGFLVHGLSGMLGADAKKTGLVTPWMWATAAALLALFGADVAGAGEPVMLAIGLVLFASITGGTAILVHAGVRGTHRWVEAPFPLLMIPLAMPPFAALLWAIPSQPLQAAASQLMLWGCVIPIILSMGFRMFSAMVRMQPPRETLFTWVSAAWGAGVLFLVASTAGLPAPLMIGRVLLAVAAVGFVVALGIFAPLRKPAGKTRFVAVDAALLVHIRIAFGFLVAAVMVGLLLSWVSLPGSEFYWHDASRHFASIGFALIIVAGITQRLLPSFLRASPSSARWMYGTLTLLAVGVGLRGAEPFLPDTAVWVRASVLFLYAGIIGYALQVGISLVRRRKPARVIRNDVDRQAIRSDGSTHSPSSGQSSSP